MTLTAAIITHLRAGLGVENIARELDIPADTIRAEVRKLRADGVLRDMWPGETVERAQETALPARSADFAGSGGGNTTTALCGQKNGVQG